LPGARPGFSLGYSLVRAEEPVRGRPCGVDHGAAGVLAYEVCYGAVRFVEDRARRWLWRRRRFRRARVARAFRRGDDVERRRRPEFRQGLAVAVGVDFGGAFGGRRR
jgi:hypothetical protein